MGEYGFVRDSLKENLIEILKECREENSSFFIYSGIKRQIAERIVAAVATAIPVYGNEMRTIAINLGLIVLV